MNYPANIEQWRRGEIVLHDADDKHPKMLMKIIGFTRAGLAKCQYVDRRRERKIYPNSMALLHDPKQWGIDVRWGEYSQENFERIVDEWEMVRRWNFYHQPGLLVYTDSADGHFATTTGGKAFMMGSHGSIWLNGHGNWALQFVHVAEISL